MRLRTKALFIVGAALTGLTLLSHLAARTLVMASFDGIEADSVRQNLERARRALSTEVESLYETTRDYSAWDETYRFASERNPDYLARQLIEEGQAEQRVAVIAIFDLQGVLLHGRVMDQDGKRRLPLPPAFAERLLDMGLVYRDPATRAGRSGVLVLPDGEWIVAACPIIDNTRTKPALGTMIMARPLDAALVRTLAETTRLDLEIRRLPIPGISGDGGEATAGSVRPVSEDQIVGRADVDDISGKPALALNVRMPRTTHKRALATLGYFTVALLGVGLAFGLSMVFLIERVVLRRIERLAASVHALREGRNLGSRVDASGQDELSRLGESINALLGTVEAAEERLRREALFDALTGLPNRTMLLDLLSRAVARARRHQGQACGLLFVDVDRFKYVNDSLGHAAGDQLLCELARRIERSVRPEDSVARLAGDEFVVLLDGLHAPADAARVAERIQSDVGKPFRLGESETFASVSIGIAISSGEQEPEELLRAADTAMYRAKALGRAGHQVFDIQMQAEATTLLNLEHNLRQALERSEFEVYYQPIVELVGSKIVGFEALVRWSHPTRGLVSPAQFIPLAEETGLIVPIGHWVLDRALSDAQHWQREYPTSAPLTLSVNLSARQLVELDLRDRVDALLKGSGFDPRRLHLEITESAIMRRPDYVTVVLGQLKDMGIQVSLDDFGIGYSSLSYLHLFPVDSLKVDRSFVSSMQTVGKQRRIVETILLLARNLGIQVVAEGVENEPQRLALIELGCVFGQGYLFSRPVDAAGVHRLLATGVAVAGSS